MKPSTYEQARDELVALALPIVVLKAFDGNEDHPLGSIMRDPGLLWELDAEHFDDYPSGHITPLWGEEGGEVIAGFRHAGGRKGFLRFDLEDDEGALHEGYSWAQICVDLLLSVHERAAPGQAESALRSAATAVSFPDVEWLLAQLAKRPDDPDDFERWHATLVGALPSYPK